MHIILDRDDFLKALTRVQGVCPQNSTIPILESCKITTSKDDNSINISGTNLDITVSTYCEAQVKKEGELIVAAKRLFNTIKSLPGGSLTVKTKANHWGTIASKPITAMLAGSHPDEYPKPPDIYVGDGGFKISSRLFKEMIGKVLFSVSSDESRASFMGAFMRMSDDGILSLVSTDGHRLSMVSRDPEVPTVPPEFLEGVIIPRKGLIEIKRILPNSGDVQISLQDNDIQLSHPIAHLSLRLVPGRFPNFAQIIPEKYDHKASVSTRDLRSALSRAANYVSKTGNTRLTLSEGSLNINAQDPEFGEFNEPVPCEYSGDGVEAGYNYRYILDILQVVDGDTVDLEIIDTESPTVIRDPEQPDELFIVMPMQF